MQTETSPRDAFDVPNELTYLNCASLAPRLKAVSAAGRVALDRMAQPWNIHATDWFSDAKTLASAFADIIGAPSLCTTLVPSVSYGIAVAARNIPVNRGENIVVIHQEYPSNYYSWQRLANERGATLRSVRAEIGTTLTEAIVTAIDRNTCIVAVANCRWTDGCLVDLARVGLQARQHGAALVVDASQSLGAYPLDVRECRPDFLVSVGYKWLLGPYGLGYLYAAEKWHSNGRPLEESWLHREGCENFAGLVDYKSNYNPGAERFGQGESAQFYLLPMAIAALSQIAAWTPEVIHHQLQGWTDELIARVAPLGLTALPRAQRAGHMVGLSSNGALRSDVVSALAERGVYVGARGNNIRVAPHLHVDGESMDRFTCALAEILR